MESMIKDQRLAQWKDENKGFEEAGNLSKSIEAVTILCRPDENHEDYKLQELLKPKRFHIECNFDRKLLRLINEVSAWKVLIPFNIRIPNEADEFVMTNRENLRVLREYAMIVVREYNQIIDFMDENERNLFAEHLQATDKIIQPGISRYKWSSKTNVDSFLGRSCRGSCSELYNKLKEFKANT
jgi:dynein heavy chain